MSNYVYNSGNTGLGRIEDAVVYVLPDALEDTDALTEAIVEVDALGDDETISEMATSTLSVVRLLNIAYLAVAVLDSGCGVASLGDLAAEVHDAEMGDYTMEFPRVTKAEA